jgi:hypothetical protein
MTTNLEALARLRVEQAVQLPALAVLHDKVEVGIGLDRAVAGRQEGVVDHAQHRLLGQHARHLDVLL